MAGTETESKDDDDRLMQKVAAGDENAFDLLFDRWKLPILNYLFRMLRNYADAEDLTLLVFEHVWKSSARYQSRGMFSSWLFTMARNQARHEFRRRRRKQWFSLSLDEHNLVSERSSGPDLNWEAEERLQTALAQLSEKQRSALILTYQTQLPPERVAQILSISLNHLYVLLHRGRERIQRLLTQPNENSSQTTPSSQL